MKSAILNFFFVLEEGEEIAPSEIAWMALVAGTTSFAFLFPLFL